MSLKHGIEAALLRILFAAFHSLPLDAASYLGGFIARSIGPLFPAHRTAKANLAKAFPQLAPKETYRLLNGMWDNLGRVIAEMAYLPNDQLHQRVTVKGMEHLPPSGVPVIFFSGHLGNWELTYPAAKRHGLKVTLIYRKANNPYVESMIAGLRATQSTDMLVKGPQGAIKLVRTIKNGQTLAMLIDQKMNDGIPVPFFGHDAMTAPAIAEFALRYHMALIPARCIRTKGCHFEIRVDPPLAYDISGDREKDVHGIMLQINALLESWIREHPEQWFWVHKRWPKS